MDTGIRRGHLYSACRLTTTYRCVLNDHRISANATGFLVQLPSLDRFALVTNRHVVDPAWAEPEKYGDFVLHGLEAEIWLTPDMRMTYELMSLDAVFHDDDTIDVCAIAVPFHEKFAATVAIFDEPMPSSYGEMDEAQQYEFAKEFAKQRGIDIEKQTGSLPRHFLPWQFLTASEEQWALLEVGEMTFFPGFPFWYDKSCRRPVMRSGALMSDPQTDTRAFEGAACPTDGNRQILFESFSTDGNSGSPVYAAQRVVMLGWENGTDTHPLMFLGINAGHIVDGKGRHAGVSRMYKASAVLDILRNIDNMP